MPLRLSKRQQREQEELKALAGPSKTQSDENVSEDDIRKRRSPSSGVIGFAALAGDDDNQEAYPPSEDESVLLTKSKKSKKKKKKSARTSTNVPQTETVKPTKSRPKAQEVSKSKGKLKSKDDDFEKALVELSEKHLAPSHSGPKTALSPLPSFDAFNSLISVSLKYLDPETELRRFFGSKVITSSGTSRPQKTRSHLVRPQSTWPPALYRAGLSMRTLTSQEVINKGTGIGPDHRERWWRFEASPRYKGTTYEYLQCVMSGDPQLFYNLLNGNPWHADTLLQMAEVFRHQEEYSTAADFMSRALFAYERAFSNAFNLTTGIHRLDFDYVENRVFFLALSRNVIDLNRRGTPRTAFEFARMLFALEPHTDPHGALLHLDYLAIKARQTEWLLGVWDAHANMDLGRGGERQFDVTILPGWCWSRALALFEKEGEAHAEHPESTQALKDAILAFPSVVPLLFDKIDLSLPPELRTTDSFKIVTDHTSASLLADLGSYHLHNSIYGYRDDYSISLIHLLSHIYAIRSFSLWKAPVCSAWLLKTLNSLSPSLFSDPVPPPPRARIQNLFSSQSNITESIYRHVVVVSPLASEFRRLTAFFPPDVTTRLTQAIEGDPLPPVTAWSVYEDAYFLEATVETRRGRVDNIPGNRMNLQPGEMNIPMGLLHLEQFMEAGGVERLRREGVDVDQLARDIPELMEAVMAQRADQRVHVDGVPVEEGGMPGGEDAFVHEGTDRADEDGGNPSDPEEDEDRDEPFFPVRVVQNLFNRLWGRSAEMAGGSGSDSEHDGDEARARAGSEGSGPRPDDVD